jgi:kynurenine 3-monooxygenase
MREAGAMWELIVLGAGPAGLAIAALLAGAGLPVTLIEASDYPNSSISEVGRSINLALSVRGQRTLAALGIGDEVMARAVPMRGRCLHSVSGTTELHPYDLVGSQAIHSIRRYDLIRSLYRTCVTRGVRCRFNERCIELDLSRRRITTLDRANRKSIINYSWLIGADGVNSVVRSSLVRSGHARERRTIIRHSYLELAIRNDRAGPLDRNALHIWPRRELMLIALPNADGSFTATLFIPGGVDGAAGQPGDAAALDILLARRFADATALISDLQTAAVGNRLARIATVECEPWCGPDTLIIGDAAHAMAPFYGQGMNCALEDCRLLHDYIGQSGPGDAAFAAFERARRADAVAIAQLSAANYDEMSAGVTDAGFRRRRSIQRELQRRFPRRFVPLYSMIAFSTIPYAEACARGRVQDEIVGELSSAARGDDDFDAGLAARLVIERLCQLPCSVVPTDA